MAVIVTFPAFRIVTVFPAMLATLLSELLKLTLSPLVAVAVRLKAASPTFLLAKAPKVIVWLVLLIVPERPVGWVRL